MATKVINSRTLLKRVDELTPDNAVLGKVSSVLTGKHLVVTIVCRSGLRKFFRRVTIWAQETQLTLKFKGYQIIKLDDPNKLQVLFLIN